MASCHSSGAVALIRCWHFVDTELCRTKDDKTMYAIGSSTRVQTPFVAIHFSVDKRLRHAKARVIFDVVFVFVVVEGGCRRRIAGC